MAQASNGDIFGDIERSIKPYRQDFPTFARLPQMGRTKQEIIDLMNSLYSIEESRWKDGYVSGATPYMPSTPRAIRCIPICGRVPPNLRQKWLP
jgi:hypothetical protein